jgi:heme exporter protein C
MRRRWIGGPEGAGGTDTVAPENVLLCAAALRPWLFSGAAVCIGVGLAIGFGAAGPPARWDVSLIVYLHVPSTWMALAILGALVAFAAAGLAPRYRIAPALAEALAPTGALFAFLTLWTGSLWGKPVWGTWWDWDLRVVANTVLLAAYLGIFAVHVAIEDPARADRITVFVAMAAACVVPIMLVTVALGPQSHRVGGGAATAAIASTGLALVTFGLVLYTAAVALTRAQCVLLERGRDSAWAQRIGMGR